MILSSDVLERQFGPTKLEILRQDDKERIICTKVAASGQVLELSKVVFRPEGIAAFPKIHQEIVSGTSMGAAFAKAGVPFKRNVRGSYRYDDAPSSFVERFGMQGPPTVTNVSILVGSESIPYADILEIYSPRVVPWEPSSEQINPRVVTRINDFGATLANIA